MVKLVEVSRDGVAKRERHADAAGDSFCLGEEGQFPKGFHGHRWLMGVLKMGEVRSLDGWRAIN